MNATARLFVLEAGVTDGSDLHSLTKVIFAACADATLDIAGARSSQLDYETVSGDVSDAVELLTAGHFSTIRLRTVACDPSILNIFRPNFDESNIPLWTVTADCSRESGAKLFSVLQQLPTVSYVVLTVEESLDLSAEHFTERSFPWTDERLVKAAVFDGGHWQIRDGLSSTA